jgi:hypothetical protein
LKLSDNLKSVAQACSGTGLNGLVNAEQEEEEERDSEAVTLLPVAAHMKLLLEAPEGESAITPFVNLD